VGAIALLEAMSYGLCCLVSDIPQNLEGIAQTGVTFMTNNVSDLRRQLQYLLRHPEKIGKFGSLAAARVEKEYNWRDITVNVNSLLAANAR